MIALAKNRATPQLIPGALAEKTADLVAGTARRA